jgi:pimeloyl-ACP methyl ester carboxylesterase
MGGKIAMWFGLTNPDKIDKLIIADIAPKSYPHSFDTFIESLKALPLDQISSRKQADDMLKPAISDPAYRQFLLQNLVLKESKYVWRVDLDIFQVNAANITAFPDSRHLSPFSGKCLVLVGEQSNFVQKADIDAMFPIADFVTIADAGHWLHVQQPIAFLSALKRFL